MNFNSNIETPLSAANLHQDEPLASAGMIRKLSIDATTSKVNSITSQLTKQTEQQACRKLFVGNLPAKTTLQELFDAFKMFGPINEQMCVVKDDNYAFIHFHDEKDAEKACKTMNNMCFKNRYIRVQYSTSQGHVKKSQSKFI